MLSLSALLWLGTAPSLAQELGAPPVVDQEGFVTMRVVLMAPVHKVQRVFSDVQSVFSLNTERTLLSWRKDGPCDEIEVQTPGLMGSMSHTSTLCPTESGWIERLRQSDDFEQHEVQWDFESTEAGTLVTYRVKVDLGIGVADRIVNARVGQSMSRTMDALRVRLGLESEE